MSKSSGMSGRDRSTPIATSDQVPGRKESSSRSISTSDQVPGRKESSSRSISTSDQVPGRKERKFKAQNEESENDRTIKALLARVEVLENQLQSRSSDQAGCVKCATLEKALHQSTQYIDRLTAELETAKEQEEDKMKSLRSELDSARKELEILQYENEAMKHDLKRWFKTAMNERESLSNATKAYTGLEEEIKNMKKQIDDKDAEIRKKTSEMEEMKIATLEKSADVAFTKQQMQEEKIKELEVECKKKLEKKDELSKMVGHNLTDNNPNIPDLSDENRPTILAEIYSEMYDNEWTDAFEELEKPGSKEPYIISELLKILQDTVRFCGKMAEQYITHLQNSASKLQEETSPKNKFQKLRLLKELRKSYAPSLAEEVFSLYIKEKKLKFVKTPKVEAYTKSCIRLCWLMSVQDPQVVIDEVKTPSKFDGDRYKTYTKSGSTMEFVVWPTMLLHAGGPILMKGVAQCK